MICELNELKLIRKQLKLENKRVVFTNGCFDIIHSGHCFYLNEAKNLGDILVVGLNTDSSVRKLKGDSRPVNNENDRAIVLDSLKAVDYVVLFPEETPFNLISELIPDVLVKGGDYTIENIVGADIVKANNGVVTTIPFVAGKSTSGLIEKILIL